MSISIALELNDEIWDKFCIFQSKGEYITVLASAVLFLDCLVWPQEILIEEDKSHKKFGGTELYHLEWIGLV